MRVIVTGKNSAEGGRQELPSSLNGQKGGCWGVGALEGRHHPESCLASCWFFLSASRLFILLKVNVAGECGLGMGRRREVKGE